MAHDCGGIVAWAVAGRYPSLVDRLAVLAAPHLLLYLKNLTLEQRARSYYFLWFLLPVLPELLLLNNDASGSRAPLRWRIVTECPSAVRREHRGRSAG